mgnify:CR=1 FL=1|jgi:hypothetical protein|tara:strand:- start:870 stop:1058 length:189 start_codon:yes stop_codon:yes gene_type:complete
MEDKLRKIMDDSTDYQTGEVDAEIAISKLLVLFPVIKCVKCKKNEGKGKTKQCDSCLMDGII